ncbi:PIN domain-containing protein [Azospirillum sp. SYSU D00513]|uniref:PIN domain-containing protein n=1 Tax=Azospirillum sp. SYSU D00513 TaxID=2812561 RepID=UPI001A972876|nr:PIN domain-containing protein [Azospirillum sp. SYSU D00513]
MALVVIDACVLFQGKLTDFLLCLAEANAFEPVWSDAIHEEWTGNLHARYGIPLSALQHRRREMERAFPAANCATDPAELARITALCSTAAQRKDAHVIATGVAAQAAVILTHNIPDFAATVLDHYGMSTVRPDAFCQSLFQTSPALVLAAAKAHRASMTRPAYSPDGYLALLAGPKVGLPAVAGALAAHKHRI